MFVLRRFWMVILISAVLSLTGIAAGSSGPNRGASLKLKVRIEALTIAKESNTYKNFKVTYCFEFVNDGTEPIILLQPNYWLKPWFEGIVLSRTVEDMRAARYVSVQTHGPALDDSPVWKRLRIKLDQPKPPGDLTRILAPGKRWKITENSYISFKKKGVIIQPDQPWAVIRKISPLYLQARFIMWPFNLEPDREWDNPKFGKRLRKRWKQYGTLWLDNIDSEPIPIILPHTQE